MIKLLDAMFPLWFVLVFVELMAGACYGLFSRNGRNKVHVVRVVSATLALVLCTMSPLLIVDSAARKEVCAAVAEIRAGKRVLLIDGAKVEDAEPYLRAFDHMRWFMVGHHSRPVPPSIDVSFAGKDDTVRVRLQRDSDREYEYWVFFPKYQTTKENYIARIDTGVFAKQPESDKASNDRDRHPLRLPFPVPHRLGDTR